MANRVVDETNKQAVELKKEFQTLMNSIIDGDDYAIHDTNQAMRVLSSITRLKTVKYIPYGVYVRDVPQEFKCPLSGEIMGDPVVLDSCQTYNNFSIQ
ncbi:hypothetical protein Ddye_025885 [Dipteronia dyeriana]|uniref:U-box domain-containing protein n=1 Tax=Dipteronia dyeriana TaxID=168575 RepID=A0AAD9TL45_9ROSI|nr:hypothetical protein Ddye_025885 [Dipteronia dyeriana]